MRSWLLSIRYVLVESVSVLSHFLLGPLLSLSGSPLRTLHLSFILQHHLFLRLFFFMLVILTASLLSSFILVIRLP